MLKTRVAVYDIKNFEYKTRGRAPEPFGSASTILGTLRAWAKALPLSSTRLQHFAREISYCYDIYRTKAHGTLICLWHESPTVDGSILFARGDGQVGDVKVTGQKVGEGVIPGVPAYFWFPAGSPHLCAIRLLDRPASSHRLSNYLKEYMWTRCRLVTSSETIDEETSRVFAPTLEDGRRCYPSVEFAPAMGDDLGDLEESLGKVVAIERKETTVHSPHGAPKIMKLFGFKEDHHPSASKMSFWADTPDGLTAGEFNTILDYYQDAGGDGMDIGFHLRGNTVQWLSERRLASYHDLDVKDRGGVVSSLENLAEALVERQTKILKGLGPKR